MPATSSPSEVAAGTWSRASDVLWRSTADGAVLRRLEDDDVVVLDLNGAEVWDVLAQPCDLDELAGRLALRYGVTAEVLRPDLVAALERLRAHGLAVLCPR